MNNKLYKCYSPNLKKFLCDNGLKYDMVCKDIKNDKTCWVWIQTSTLSKLLLQWSKNKPNK